MNRHSFQQKLVESCKHGSARGRPAFCLVMADVDHFKVYNDTHGHPMGDVVLRNIARVLSCGVRQTDLAARYGGEEFVLIIKGVEKAQALCAADRIRRAVAEECKSLGHITISMGVAEFPGDADSPGELIEKADNALYTAKYPAEIESRSGIVRMPKKMPRPLDWLRGSAAYWLWTTPMKADRGWPMLFESAERIWLSKRLI